LFHVQLMLCGNYALQIVRGFSYTVMSSECLFQLREQRNTRIRVTGVDRKRYKELLINDNIAIKIFYRSRHFKAVLKQSTSSVRKNREMFHISSTDKKSWGSSGIFVKAFSFASMAQSRA